MIGALQTDGWLPLALPADATRFRTSIATVAETLSAAGGQVTEAGENDAVIATRVPGDAASHWLVVIDAGNIVGRRGQGALHDVAARTLEATRALVCASRAHAAVRRAGYERIDSFVWDFGTKIRLDRPQRLSVGGQLRSMPRRWTVVARRDPWRPTIWEGAIAAATGSGNAVDATLRETRITATGVAMGIAADSVHRCAVGPAVRHLRDGARALRRLHATSVPEPLARLTPRHLAEGSVGIGAWTVENRMAGQTPERLTPRVFEEVVALLPSLFALGASHRTTIVDDALEIDRTWPGSSEALLSWAARLDDALGHVPRGFAHGDLWRENLLAENGRLVGIVDWVRAADGRLPLSDLLHLSVAERELAGQPFGVTVVSELVEWARGGGDEVAVGLCGRLGFAPTPEVLEALVYGYWFGRVADEFVGYRDRPSQREWVRTNVELVLGSQRA